MPEKTLAKDCTINSFAVQADFNIERVFYLHIHQLISNTYLQRHFCERAFQIIQNKKKSFLEPPFLKADNYLSSSLFVYSVFRNMVRNEMVFGLLSRSLRRNKTNV